LFIPKIIRIKDGNIRKGDKIAKMSKTDTKATLIRVNLKETFCFVIGSEYIEEFLTAKVTKSTIFAGE